MNLEDILSGTADGAFAVDGEGTIVAWNAAAARILGHAAATVIGRRCCDLFAGLDVSGNRLCYPECQVLSLAGMREPIQHFEMATHSREGHILWLSVSIIVLPDAGRGGRLVVHLFRDITLSRAREMLIRERLADTLPAGAGGQPEVPLTRRELETLKLMRTGAGTRKMADRLHVSPATVRNHVQNILTKLGVHSRLEAVALATSEGWLQTPRLARPSVPEDDARR